MHEQIKRFANLEKVINSKYLDDLGKIELINDNFQIDILQIKVIPYEGIN
jgi:hypothetical protein